MFGLSAGELALIPLSLALVCGLAALVHFRPKAGVLLWLSTVAFVPFWMGASFVVYFVPTSLLGILLLVAMRPGLPRLGAVDLIVVFFFVACLAPVLVVGGHRARCSGRSPNGWLHSCSAACCPARSTHSGSTRALLSSSPWWPASLCWSSSSHGTRS